MKSIKRISIQKGKQTNNRLRMTTRETGSDVLMKGDFEKNENN